MAVDIQKLFNEEIPAKISGNPEAAKQVGATFQMNIGGEGGGEWFINLKDDPSIKAGKEPAECTITISAEDFQKLHENPQANGMQLFFAGKLKVDGNQMLAMKLSKIFAIGA